MTESTQPSTVGGCFICMSRVVWNEDGEGVCLCEGTRYRKHSVYMEGPPGNWEWRDTYKTVVVDDVVVGAERYKWVCKECLGMLTVDFGSHGSACPYPECGGVMREVKTFDGWKDLRKEIGLEDWEPDKVLRLRRGLDYLRTW